MQCEDCGDTVSLSNAYRDDDGNFVCEECHTDDQQQRQQGQSRTQQRTQSAQQQRTPPASTEKQTEQNSSGERSTAAAQGAEKSHTEADGGHVHTLTEDKPGEHRFKTLLSISKFISGVGWVIVGLGALAGVIGVIAAMSLPPPLEEAVFALAAGLGGGLWFAVMGLLTVAAGQVYSCFVAIERNTRSTFRLIQERDD
jgi:hypothetical protein